MVAFTVTSLSPGCTGTSTRMPLIRSSSVTGRSSSTLPSLSVTVRLSPTSVPGFRVTSAITVPSSPISSSLYTPSSPVPVSSTVTDGGTLSMGLVSESSSRLPDVSVMVAFTVTSLSPGCTGTSTLMPLVRSSSVTGRSSNTVPSLSVTISLSPTSVPGFRVTSAVTVPSGPISVSL